MRGWRKSQKYFRKYPQKTISFFFVNLKKWKWFLLEIGSPPDFRFAVARTSQSPFPLCDMAPKITLRNKYHDFEWIKRNWIQTNRAENKVWIHFLLDWLNKIRTWLKKLISDTTSLTENLRENNLTRQNNSAEKILCEKTYWK